jgi:hypothetical protein
MVHFQIKGTEQMNIPWLLDSWRDIGPEGVLEGEIKGGVNFESRELDVEEEENVRGMKEEKGDTCEEL